MRIPKELADKFKQYRILKDQTDKLFEELESWLNDNAGMADCGMYDFGASQKPSGTLQTDGEYCEEHRIGEDSCDGIYYWPVDSCDWYAWSKYSV